MIFKPAKIFYDEQFSFEKQAAERLPLLKASHGSFRGYWKAFQQIQNF
jgi:hypothetical protein